MKTVAILYHIHAQSLHTLLTGKKWDLLSMIITFYKDQTLKSHFIRLSGIGGKS
jgi:hypothetical protein